jgi:hypothetical protein
MKMFLETQKQNWIFLKKSKHNTIKTIKKLEKFIKQINE